ncbi:DUF412 domain-containing protein [Catenovulum sp. 2E275]|uniref:terminus macrodomain insulation protein YfbV n=1 Tax=Catenovulum sp. 2E275 TaxID=2980497 RepID=UPI0021D1FF21|nr:terminus macrodomain insulation protein YfbV [Catenovulum sp. 2E275]MCU4674624.1 DUF412 domain-containing protein [Catenovulum sp. 2E275]
MSSNLLSTIQKGYTYSKNWPLRPELYPLFPECRVIKATQFALFVTPIIAVFSFFTQFFYLGESFLAQSIAMCSLILSLPIQGFIWLGKRAKSLLPVSLAAWYYQLESKFIEQGIEFKGVARKPTYLDLASALKIAFNKLDETWIKEKF